MTPDEYKDLESSVEQAGFFTTFEDRGEYGSWLVVVSARVNGRLQGNSFRMRILGGRWQLITWVPAMYSVPEGTDLTALCSDCLRASRVPLYRVPDELIAKYGLAEVTAEEYEEFCRDPAE